LGGQRMGWWRRWSERRDGCWLYVGIQKKLPPKTQRSNPCLILSLTRPESECGQV
jgi:hypothetical protein